VTGDIANAGYLALAVLLALANAAVWAPALGMSVAGPLTGMLTDGTTTEERNLLLWASRRCLARGARHAALAFALIEGVRHPDRPAAFLLGLQCSTPGSRLERVFALEVWRFENVRNCTMAFRVLQRQGIDPRPHRNQEVNLTLLALEKPPCPERQPLPVPASEVPIQPKRNTRIQLFAGATPPPAEEQRTTSSPVRAHPNSNREEGPP
jgi:hypothetical protein